MNRDIFNHFADLGMRAEAVIIGTGPNVLAGLPRIPNGAYLLGVNGAITLPIKLHAHGVLDQGAPRLRPSLTDGKGWYPETKIPGVIFIRSAQIRDPLADYEFTSTIDMCNCTIAGAMLAILYECHKRIGLPKIVYLCGVDMGGGRYFNGYRTACPGRWSQTDAFNALIRHVEANGLPVRTLSETELDVERA